MSNYDVVVRDERILETQNYGKFRKLLGNRGVDPGRLRALQESINQVGWIPNPIIVNEKYEIIDGQARCKKAEEIGAPIQYIVYPKLGIKECQAMNKKSSAWTLEQYIQSYSDLGYMDCTKLMEARESFKDIDIILHAYLLTGKEYSKPTMLKDIKNSKFKVNEGRAAKAEDIYEYLERAKPIQKKIKGSKRVFYSCLVKIYEKFPECSEPLLKAVADNYLDIPPCQNRETTLKYMSAVYNRGKRKEKQHQFDFELR